MVSMSANPFILMLMEELNLGFYILPKVTRNKINSPI